MEIEIGYPTLFGWEIQKRLAYFTSGHELSSVITPTRRSISSNRSNGSKRYDKDMASEMPTHADATDLEKYA